MWARIITGLQADGFVFFDGGADRWVGLDPLV
jgi:hypothetical protein